MTIEAQKTKNTYQRKISGVVSSLYKHKSSQNKKPRGVNICDIPPLSKDGQSNPGSIRGANTEALTHNTHIHGPNTELLHKFLSYKEIHS
jgi:hypothetical protein